MLEWAQVDGRGGRLERAREGRGGRQKDMKDQGTWDRRRLRAGGPVMMTQQTITHVRDIGNHENLPDSTIYYSSHYIHSNLTRFDVGKLPASF